METLKYRVTVTDIFGHDTVLWEGKWLTDGQENMECCNYHGNQDYDQYVVLEKVTYDENGKAIQYDLIDELVWFDTVEDWEKWHTGSDQVTSTVTDIPF